MRPGRWTIRYDVSSVGCSNALLHLLELHHTGELHTDPKWSRLTRDAHTLATAITTREQEGPHRVSRENWPTRSPR